MFISGRASASGAGHAPGAERSDDPSTPAALRPDVASASSELSQEILQHNFFQLTVPVIAATGGVVFIGEVLTSRLIVATLGILGGIALALVASEWQSKPSPPVALALPPDDR